MSALLTTDDPYVTILDDTEDYGSMGGAATAWFSGVDLTVTGGPLEVGHVFMGPRILEVAAAAALWGTLGGALGAMLGRRAGRGRDGGQRAAGLVGG